MTGHFATYSDAAYLPRLKALYASMQRHCGDFELHVLAWDSAAADGLSGLTRARVTTVADFLSAHPELHKKALPGPQRTDVEHFWTCGPMWLVDCMEKTGEPVTYSDADIMFHSSVDPMFAEIGRAPAGIVPHNFQPRAMGLPGPQMETHYVFGLYNVGVVHLANLDLARTWAEQCRAWCYDKVDRTPAGYLEYGDQRYLDQWPANWGARVLHPSVNVGPWSIHTMELDVRDGVIYFGGRPLISYHYSGYRELPENHTVLTRPEYRLTKRQEDLIYMPYIEALEEASR